MTTFARRLITLVLLSTLPMPMGCKKEEEDPEAAAKKLASDLEEAVARRRNHKLKDAEKIYTRVLETHEGQAEALAGMGLIRFEQNKFDEALKFLEEAVKSTTDSGELWYALGRVHSHQERFGEAADAFAKAYELEAENYEYALSYGKALKRGGNFQEAEKVLRIVADEDPLAMFVHTEIADCQREQGDLEGALKTYMKAQSTYGSDKMARAGAAMVYEAKGDLTHAMNEWSGYIRMDCCSDYSNDVAKVKLLALEKQAIEAGLDVPDRPPEMEAAAGGEAAAEGDKAG